VYSTELYEAQELNFRKVIRGF
jgi:hypothetical protein